MTRSVKFILLIITIVMTSLAANGSEVIGKPKVTVVQPLTATQKGRVRVSVQRINKPKIFVGNPHKITLFANDRNDDFIEVDDVITAYRREDLQKIYTDELSEYTRWRLFLARQLALFKYKEVHG